MLLTAYSDVAIDVQRVVVGHIFDKAVIEWYAVRVIYGDEFGVAAVDDSCGYVRNIALGIVGNNNKAVVCAGHIKPLNNAVIERSDIALAVVQCF